MHCKPGGGVQAPRACVAWAARPWSKLGRCLALCACARAGTAPSQVKDGTTFLDLIAEQVKVMRREYGSAVPFILMDSFSTSDDTRAFLTKAHADLLEVGRGPTAACAGGTALRLVQQPEPLARLGRSL